MNNQSLRALIDQMHAAAEEILRVTALVSLTGEPERHEKEVSDFHFLIEKREPMFKRLTALKKSIDSHPDYAAGAHAEEDAAKLTDAQRLLTELLALDKAHLQAMARIEQSLKASIRDIKSGRKLNRVYAHPMELENTAGFLDTKK